ncbi:MAG TPA: hypothetical protein DF783_02415, partial [Acidimicrobiaceae bacterium]|nr:hypothetical protein [Acidimicrobiaceae bacterium]
VGCFFLPILIRRSFTATSIPLSSSLGSAPVWRNRSGYDDDAPDRSEQSAVARSIFQPLGQDETSTPVGPDDPVRRSGS